MQCNFEANILKLQRLKPPCSLRNLRLVDNSVNGALMHFDVQHHCWQRFELPRLTCGSPPNAHGTPVERFKRTLDTAQFVYDFLQGCLCERHS